MQHVIPNYNFTITQEGEFTKFVYKKTPLSYKAIAPMCINTLLPAGYLTYLFRPQTIQSMLIAYVITLLGTSAFIVVVINLLRGKGEFKLGKTQLIAGNKTYNLDHISSFVIKDPDGGYVETSYTVRSNHNLFNVGSNIGRMQGDIQNIARQGRAALKEHFLNVSYKIAIRYGSKEINIARGLGEVEAETLFKKVTAMAGYNK